MTIKKKLTDTYIYYSCVNVENAKAISTPQPCMRVKGKKLSPQSAWKYLYDNAHFDVMIITAIEYHTNIYNISIDDFIRYAEPQGEPVIESVNIKNKGD